MPIKGLSERRRLPRAGIIRLGIRVKTDKACKCSEKDRKKCFLCMGTGVIHRPKETDYFVVPDKVKSVYGMEPKKLKILIPVEDEEVFFRQYYYSYGNGIMLCQGDGEKAMFWNFEEGDYCEKKCPCEKLENNKCSHTGILQFILPEVEESAGIWQITTHSKNSIIDLNSGIDYIRGIAGRIAFIPLWLIREEIQTQKLDKNGAIKGKHWTLKFSFDVSLQQLQKAGQTPIERFFLPMPDESAAAGLLPMPKNGDANEPIKLDPIATLILTDGTEKLVNRYEAMQYFKKIKAKMTEMDYSLTLETHGFSKADQIPDGKLGWIFAALVKQYKESASKEQEPGQKKLIQP